MPDCQTELVFPQFNQCVRYIKFSQAISTWRGMHIYVTHCSEVLMMHKVVALANFNIFF